MARNLEELRAAIPPVEDEEETNERPVRLAGGVPVRMKGLIKAAIPEVSTVADRGAERTLKSGEKMPLSDVIMKDRGGNVETLADKDTAGMATAGKPGKEPYAVTKESGTAAHEGIHNLINKAMKGDVERIHTVYGIVNGEMDPNVYSIMEDYLQSNSYRPEQVEQEVVSNLRDLFTGKRAGEKNASQDLRQYLEHEGMRPKQVDKFLIKARREYNKAAKRLNSLTIDEVEKEHARRLKEHAEDMENFFKSDSMDQ